MMRFVVTLSTTYLVSAIAWRVSENLYDKFCV